MSGKSTGYEHRMHLQNYTESRSLAKQMIKTWSDQVSIWARLDLAYKGEEILGGVRQSKTPQMASVSQTWIYTRFRSDVTITPLKRIRFGTRYFDIEAVYTTSGHGKEFKILCREVQV